MRGHIKIYEEPATHLFLQNFGLCVYKAHNCSLERPRQHEANGKKEKGGKVKGRLWTTKISKVDWDEVRDTRPYHNELDQHNETCAWTISRQPSANALQRMATTSHSIQIFAPSIHSASTHRFFVKQHHLHPLCVDHLGHIVFNRLDRVHCAQTIVKEFTQKKIGKYFVVVAGRFPSSKG